MKGSRPSRRGGKTRFRTVGLVAKVSPRALRLTAGLERALRRRGVEVIFDEETGQAMRRDAWVRRDRIARTADLVIVLGGDGTLLSVAREAPTTTPVLGINVGALGYLTGLKQEEALSRLDEVLAGGFREDRRRRLDVRIPAGPDAGTYRALNDAVLNRKLSGRISTFSVSVGGTPVARFRGDGVIVATPTGSTAYSLSAGGPILDPALAAVVVTPISPHTLMQRPLVVPASATIGLKVIGRRHDEGVHLALDGQASFMLDPGRTIEVREAGSSATLLRPPESDDFQNLSEKLNWGV
ncbi:MAG TPA: NAD(+)/NADH kinase [Thermoanaerobaculia bacterium]|nr:NAD(+)/NADH kinase [Thermoanaerobaculia bacterium]